MAKTTNRRKFLAAAGVAGAAATPAAAQEKASKKVIYSNGKKPEKTPLVQWHHHVWRACLHRRYWRALRRRHQGAYKARPGSDRSTAERSRLLDGQGSEVQCLPERSQGLCRNERNVSRPVRRGASRRTTIAAAGGIPGNSLVEIDVIACV